MARRRKPADDRIKSIPNPTNANTISAATHRAGAVIDAADANVHHQRSNTPGPIELRLPPPAPEGRPSVRPNHRAERAPMQTGR